MDSKSRDNLKGRIRLCLVVQNRLLRETMVRLFQKKAGFAVVGKEYAGETLPDSPTTEPCDVLLLDSLKPGCAKDLGEGALRAKVVFFGMDDDPECFLRAIRSGARGYLLKDASAEEIVSAVRRVAAGEAFCPPRLCMWLFAYVAREKKALREGSEKADAAKLGLSYRQRQLMVLVRQGMTNKEIANKLNLSESNVKNHIARVMRQLNAQSRHEAAVLIHAEDSGGAQLVLRPERAFSLPLATNSTRKHVKKKGHFIGSAAEVAC